MASGGRDDLVPVASPSPPPLPALMPLKPLPKSAVQRDLDAAVVRAAPAVCDEIIRRLQAHRFDETQIAENKFVQGFKVCRDADISIVVEFKRECS